MEQNRTTDRTVEPADKDAVDRRRAEQAHQMDELGGHPTVPTLPRPMFMGMVKGTFIGGAIGAVVLTPLAFAPILELSLVAKLVIVWIAGFAAGAGAGAVFFGGAKAEAANPENDEYVYGDGPQTQRRREGPGLD